MSIEKVNLCKKVLRNILDLVEKEGGILCGSILWKTIVAKNKEELSRILDNDILCGNIFPGGILCNDIDFCVKTDKIDVKGFPESDIVNKIQEIYEFNDIEFKYQKKNNLYFPNTTHYKIQLFTINIDLLVCLNLVEHIEKMNCYDHCMLYLDLETKELKKGGIHEFNSIESIVENLRKGITTDSYIKKSKFIKKNRIDKLKMSGLKLIN